MRLSLIDSMSYIVVLIVFGLRETLHYEKREKWGSSHLAEGAKGASPLSLHLPTLSIFTIDLIIKNIIISTTIILNSPQQQHARGCCPSCPGSWPRCPGSWATAPRWHCACCLLPIPSLMVVMMMSTPVIVVIVFLSFLNEKNHLKMR